MEYSEAVAKLTDKIEFNLMDFNNFSLNSSGELAVSHYFHHAIYMKLGSNILELTKLAAEPEPEESSDKLGLTSHILYVIRNLTSPQEAAALTLDNSRRDVGHLAGNDTAYSVYGRQAITIGRALDATPELDLDKSASRKHLLFRLGNMAGNLHFMDLDSTNGSSIFLDPRDTNGVVTPWRMFFPNADGSGAETIEKRNGRWTRE